MSSRRAEALLAGVLVLSLGGKLASNGTAPAPDHRHIATRLSEVLEAAGFQVQARSDLLGSIAVSARRSGCRIWVVEYSPHATSAAVITGEAAATGRLTYLYGGRTFDRAPTAAPLLAFYWWREVRRIGLPASRRPVVARAASPSCNLSNIAWAQLATVAR
jgi:hypothetical protein